MSFWELHEKYRFAPDATSSIRHADLERMLPELKAKRPDAMRLEEIGHSFEGRTISKVVVGTGDTKVLAWSQMHGNEPTHTAVLLDVIHLLQTAPDNPVAARTLENCQLHLVLMLNPDGAERYIRRNAQDIDINRDALHLQSPEGRLLKKLVEELQPEFALNLHNQHPRTSVGQAPARPAAVSLLVPPLDLGDTQTQNTRKAKQIAGSFLSAVRPFCEGMISRYDADFMPRCFGEWVQQQGPATLTIEAGGWTTPHVDGTPLVRVHFVGLLALLDSIASGSYEAIDVELYDSLPRSNEYTMFDLVLRSANVPSTEDRQGWSADLGINLHPHVDQAGGVIADLGDLSVTDGKCEVDASEMACLPGRVAFAPEITPTSLPSDEAIAEFLRCGVTTVIGTIDPAEPSQLDALAELAVDLPLPVNVGFVFDLQDIEEEQVAMLLTQALSAGVLGVLGNEYSNELEEMFAAFGIVRIAHDTLPLSIHAEVTWEQAMQDCVNAAALFGEQGIAQISQGRVADLSLHKPNKEVQANSAIDWNSLQQVLVGGNVVWKEGKQLSASGGRLLRNRYCCSPSH